MTRVVLSDPRNSAALGMELAGLFALKKFEDQIAVLLEGTKAALKGAKHRLGNLPVIGFPPPNFAISCFVERSWPYIRQCADRPAVDVCAPSYRPIFGLLPIAGENGAYRSLS